MPGSPLTTTQRGRGARSESSASSKAASSCRRPMNRRSAVGTVATLEATLVHPQRREQRASRTISRLRSVHDLSPAELRVLGSLLEKQRTTPDVYPLTLNALRAACNQSTNRDPVVAYDEETIRDALHHLGRRRWTRLTSSH